MRYDKRRMKDEVVGWIVGLLIAAMFCGVLFLQFTIYRKKHGDHMTVLDFLLDSERR